jgi:hypothetical protein
MGMDPKYYHQALEPICNYVENAAGDATNLQGKIKDGEWAGSTPEKGHTLVLAFKQAETTCDWCYERVEQPNLKVYSRDFGSKVWQGKCKTCKQKKVIIK